MRGRPLLGFPWLGGCPSASSGRPVASRKPRGVMKHHFIHLGGSSGDDERTVWGRIASGVGELLRRVADLLPMVGHFLGRVGDFWGRVGDLSTPLKCSRQCTTNIRLVVLCVRSLFVLLCGICTLCVLCCFNVCWCFCV